MVEYRELMIGDYLNTSFGIGRVVRIDANTVSFVNKHEEFDIKCSEREIWMSGIPLTPEILEKNGFSFTRNNNTDSVWNGWWIYKGLELAAACPNKEGNWPCFINIYDSNIKCEYVHQLQHALRLCGIEKEIEL